MSTNRQDLTPIIVARLKTIESLHDRVFDHEPGDFQGYPTVTVVGDGNIDEIADNRRNLREYLFNINVYFQRLRQSPLSSTDKAERIRRKLEDEIMASFDSYRDLDGNALWILIESGGWAYSGDNNLAMFTLIMRVTKAVNLSIN